MQLLGPVPPTQVVHFMRGADASPILYRPDTPNYLFALTNGYFHAICAGLPVLYPPLPEMAAVAIEHGIGIEVDAADPEAIASGVGALMDDPAARARFAANSAAAANAVSWEHEEALIGEMLGGT